jgi:hypothetical protein
MPRVAAPPSPPMPTRGRSPRRPLPLLARPAPRKKHAHQGKARTAPMCSEPCGPGLPLPLKCEGCGGDEPLRFCRNGQPLPWGKLSGGAAPGDSSPAAAAAYGNAAQAGAARCGAGRRNCCRFPAARPARGASGRARDIPESNTAPSNRADIASVCLTVSVSRIGGTGKTPQNQRDCAPERLVCQGKYIQLVGVPFRSGRRGGASCIFAPRLTAGSR